MNHGVECIDDFCRYQIQYDNIIHSVSLLSYGRFMTIYFAICSFLSFFLSALSFFLYDFICMALYSLYCAEVLLRNCSLTHSLLLSSVPSSYFFGEDEICVTCWIMQNSSEIANYVHA